MGEAREEGGRGGSDKFLMKRTPKRYISRLPAVERRMVSTKWVGLRDCSKGHTYSEAEIAE